MWVSCLLYDFSNMIEKLYLFRRVVIALKFGSVCTSISTDIFLLDDSVVSAPLNVKLGPFDVYLHPIYLGQSINLHDIINCIRINLN